MRLTSVQERKTVQNRERDHPGEVNNQTRADQTQARVDSGVSVAVQTAHLKRDKFLLSIAGFRPVVNTDRPG